MWYKIYTVKKCLKIYLCNIAQDIKTVFNMHILSINQIKKVKKNLAQFKNTRNFQNIIYEK